MEISIYQKPEHDTVHVDVTVTRHELGKYKRIPIDLRLAINGEQATGMIEDTVRLVLGYSNEQFVAKEE